SGPSFHAPSAVTTETSTARTGRRHLARRSRPGRYSWVAGGWSSGGEPISRTRFGGSGEAEPGGRPAASRAAGRGGGEGAAVVAGWGGRGGRHRSTIPGAGGDRPRSH